MAVNSLYPGFWKLRYDSGVHTHTMIVPVKPELVGDVWYHYDKDGNLTADLETAATAFVNIIKVFLPDGGSFQDVELWTLSSPTAAPVFQELVDLSIAGTNVGAAMNNGQLLFTFRTVAGGLYRLYLMESAGTLDSVSNPPFSGATATAVAALVASSSYVAGRDGSFLSSCVRSITKVNDALRKKYLLDA